VIGGSFSRMSSTSRAARLFRAGHFQAQQADKPSLWRTTAFYPRVPNSEWIRPGDRTGQIFWIVKNGIRHTGVGAWGNLVSDTENWKVSLFLGRIESLPPTVASEWKNPPGQ